MYQPRYTITDNLLWRISESETLRTQIAVAPVQVAWMEAIRFDALVRRAHFSTAIEGNPLTLPEVKALAEARRIAVPDHAKREVLNYLAALHWIAQQRPETKLTEAAVLKLHRLVTGGLLGPHQVGAYKRSANVIMSAGRVVYRPPGPAEAQPGTRALLQWLDGQGQSAHPIVASACAHYEIARLHPFMDGNGRVARTLATWVLYHRGFDTQHLFAVDQYYKEDHEGYYQALQRVHQEGEDLTSWLEYVALAVWETLRRTYQRIQQLALPPSVTGLALTRPQERLLLELQGRGQATIEEMQRILNVERAQVYRVLKPLVTRGVVQKSTTRPVSYFLSRR
jgi:Fic family protein